MQHLILFSSLRVAEPYKTYQLFNLRSHAKICFVRSLSFASLFLNAAACRGRGRGVIIFASILSLFLLHRKGNAQILSYSLLKEEKMSQLN